VEASSVQTQVVEASSTPTQPVETSSASDLQNIEQPDEASSPQSFQEIIGEKQNEYQIKVTVDPNWLLDPVRSFPINIDPSIIHDTKTQFDSGDSLNRVESITGPKVQINPAGGNDVNTQLLLHANGANNSTTFLDSSSTKKTVTAFGNAKISTAQSKFGGSSASFDGTNSYLSLPDSSDFNLNTEDFTFDYWMKSSSSSTSIMDTLSFGTNFRIGHNNTPGSGYYGICFFRSG
jgi:hypothetical protein